MDPRTLTRAGAPAPVRWSESEERLRTAFAHASVGMAMATPEGRFLQVNPAYCRITGYSETELLATDFQSITHPEDLPRNLAAIRQLLANEIPGFVIDKRYVRKDGAAVWVQNSVALARDAEGRPQNLIALVQDVTGRKQAEAELRKKTEVLQTIVDNIPVMITFADREARVEWVNRHFERVLGWSAAEAREVDMMSVSLPDPRSREEALEFYRSLEPGWRDFPTRTKTGHTIHTAWANVALSDGAVICFGQDVTDRKRTERERERRLTQLQSVADIAVAIGASHSFDDIIQAVTEGARRTIGAHQCVTSLTADDNASQAIHTVSLSDKYAAYRGYDAKPDGSGIYRLVCQTNRSMRLTQSELESHAGWRGFGAEAARHPPLVGWLAAPLVGRDGRNLGLIQLSDKYEGDFGGDDEAILVQLAQLASEAIENARLLGEVSAAHGRLEALSRRLVTLQEEERRAIARELHDEVGQLLTALRLMMEDDAPARREEKTRIVGELIGRVRDMSMNLRPPMLDPLGLLPTLLWQIERFEAQTAVKVAFQCANLDRRFPHQVEITAFRIVQEALTNIARHAGVSRARVEVWADGKNLGARIGDEGRGFVVGEALAGHSSGLAGMKERCRLLGGRLTIESAPGAGTRLWPELPLTGAVAPEVSAP